MKRRKARLFFGAFFFLCGLASAASLSWVQKLQAEAFRRNEPFFRCPVPVLSDRALIRNDAHGKGAFGVSRDGGRTHQGIDLLVPAGRPVFASKSGRVAYAGMGKGYGWYVELAHPDGRRTRYAHLGRLLAGSGDWVVSGQTLGLAGKSGNADDPRVLPHVHFEIRENDKAVDPLGGPLDPSLTVR